MHPPRDMHLAELIQDLPEARVLGARETEVRAVREDSRKIEPGDVFVAVRGMTVDGHDFARAAVERGAAAVVVEREVPVAAPQVIVSSGSRALGVLAARAAGRPTDRLRMIGVTGTNGKTTTTYLVERILDAAARRPGVVGTVNNRYAGKHVPTSYTTPTAEDVQGLFRDMVAAGTTDVVMEVTSAALAMERLAGVTFQVAAFSNLTQDHLDVHGSMDAYFQAKARLFAERLAPDGTAVANIDDPRGEELLARAPAGARRLRVSSQRDADVCVVQAASSSRGITCTLRTPRGLLSLTAPALFGAYNVDNLALAVAVAEALGIEHDAIARGIAELGRVPGRVEPVPNRWGLDVFVDYAHTPDALERVIAALRPLARGRLIVVFGCGGDRDPTKRPRMGAIVARDADVAVVTSDNPRTEEPSAIIDMILAGMAPARAAVHVEPDRRRAIALAVGLAREGDVVLVAGKGHEDYQILGKTKVHFDDREEATAAIAALPPLFTLDELLAATGGTLLRAGAGAGEATGFGGVSIDGRTARPGDLYIAIRGESLDGHAFGQQARAAGAVGFLVERDVPGLPGPVVQVPDARVAFGALARHLRRRWRGTLVGITGSAGKTTTKELVAAMLRATAGDDAVLATGGSLNNETGVPLTLARLRPWHTHAVIEMGMRGVGHIEYLRAIAEPEIGVVVNAGVAHVGVVGSVDAIAEGKSEIWTGARVVVRPAGDARLERWARTRAPDARHVTFGAGDGDGAADVALVSYQGGRAVFEIGDATLACRLGIVGAHNARNAACALAVAVALELDLVAAVRGLETARPAPHRSELVEIGGRRVLDDCYNANPASMAAALETLAALAAGGGKAVAILGDMLELGASEDAEHEALGAKVGELGIERLITLGERARLTARAARAAGVPHVEVVHIDDPERAARLAAEWTGAGDAILVKASRGMRLERVLAALREVAR